MKRLLLILLLITASYTLLYAQSETPSDSIPISMTHQAQFGEFLIDMNLLKTSPLPPITREFMLGTDVRKDYSSYLIPDQRWVFTQGSMPATFATSYFYNTPWSSTQQFQMATFKINDNLRLNLYGQYNADGFRVPNRSALPWERNNFAGGMEFKAKDFSIRIDVRQGHHSGYPY